MDSVVYCDCDYDSDEESLLRLFVFTYRYVKTYSRSHTLSSTYFSHFAPVGGMCWNRIAGSYLSHHRYDTPVPHDDAPEAVYSIPYIYESEATEARFSHFTISVVSMRTIF